VIRVTKEVVVEGCDGFTTKTSNQRNRVDLASENDLIRNFRTLPIFLGKDVMFINFISLIAWQSHAAKKKKCNDTRSGEHGECMASYRPFSAEKVQYSCGVLTMALSP
jgi:hypothetical protein